MTRATECVGMKLRVMLRRHLYRERHRIENLFVGPKAFRRIDRVNAVLGEKPNLVRRAKCMYIDRVGVAGREFMFWRAGPRNNWGVALSPSPPVHLPSV